MSYPSGTDLVEKCIALYHGMEPAFDLQSLEESLVENIYDIYFLLNLDDAYTL